MKHGKHDSQASKTSSSRNWMNSISVILLFNYHDPKVVKDIERQVKELKDKEKVSCLTSNHEYNQYMGGVDLTHQMYVSDQFGRRSKGRFYLSLYLFFDILDTGVMNFKIIYDKMDSTVRMSAMDFHLSLAHLMVEKFSNQEKSCPNKSIFKKLLRREI